MQVHSQYKIVDMEQYLWSTWTPDQDLYLISQIYFKELKNNDRTLLLRNIEVCNNRFRYVMDSAPWLWRLLSDNKWSPAQDIHLLTEVSRNQNWQHSADELNLSAEECRQRYALIQTVRTHKPAIINDYYSQHPQGQPPPYYLFDGQTDLQILGVDSEFDPFQFLNPAETQVEVAEKQLLQLAL